MRSHLRESGSRLALAKSKRTQSAEDLRMDVSSYWADDCSIGRAVRVANGQTGRDLAFNHELSSVLSPMVRRAKRHERISAVIATFRARDEVVQIKKGGVPATRYDATPAVPSPHLPTHRRRDILMGSSAFAARRATAFWSVLKTHLGTRLRIHVGAVSSNLKIHVGAVSSNLKTHVGAVSSNPRTHVGAVSDGPDVLGIAARHLDDFRVDLNLLPPSLLPAPMAFTADGHG
jgi:hypothetical protein